MAFNLHRAYTRIITAIIFGLIVMILITWFPIGIILTVTIMLICWSSMSELLEDMADEENLNKKWIKERGIFFKIIPTISIGLLVLFLIIAFKPDIFWAYASYEYGMNICVGILAIGIFVMCVVMTQAFVENFIGILGGILTFIAIWILFPKSITYEGIQESHILDILTFIIGAIFTIFVLKIFKKLIIKDVSRWSKK